MTAIRAIGYWMDDHPLIISIGGILGSIAGVIGLIVFWTRPVDLMVTGHRWIHEQQVEDFQPRQQSAWCDYMPQDAYSVTSRREQRDSHQQYAGDTCTTDSEGRQTCTANYISVPDYDDKCYFTVDRWDYERSVLASGEQRTEAVYWPNPDIMPCAQVTFGCERPGQQIATYTIHLHSGDQTYDCNYGFARWLSMGIETWWRGDVGNITGRLRCDGLVQR